MNITTKQKKLIFIILGSALLIFILVFGINTYYKESEGIQYQQIIKNLQEQQSTCDPSTIENGYKTCCTIVGEGIKEGKIYDCSSQTYFEEGQRVYIFVDFSDFDISMNIPYDEYFLSIRSDLQKTSDENLQIDYSNELEGSIYTAGPLNKYDSFFYNYSGIIPEDKEEFTLLDVRVYPNNVFRDGEETMIHLEGKTI